MVGDLPVEEIFIDVINVHRAAYCSTVVSPGRFQTCPGQLQTAHFRNNNRGDRPRR